MKLLDIIQKMDEGFVLSRVDSPIGIMKTSGVKLPREVAKGLLGCHHTMFLKAMIVSVDNSGHIEPYVFTSADLSATDWKCSLLTAGETKEDVVKYKGVCEVDNNNVRDFYMIIARTEVAQILSSMYNHNTERTTFILESSKFKPELAGGGLRSYTMIFDEDLDKVEFKEIV